MNDALYDATKNIYRLTPSRYDDLLEQERTLNALIRAGVEQWEGWDRAMEELENES